MQNFQYCPSLVDSHDTLVINTNPLTLPQTPGYHTHPKIYHTLQIVQHRKLVV